MRPLISGIMPLKEFAAGHRLTGIERAEMIVAMTRHPRIFKGNIAYYMMALRPGKKRIEYYPLADWDWVHTHENGANFYWPRVEINIDCAISGACVKVMWCGRLVQADWASNPHAAKRGDVLNPDYGVRFDG